MVLVKFIFYVWEDEIVPMLSELHGTRWPGFDGEETVKAVLFNQAASKKFIFGYAVTMRPVAENYSDHLSLW